MKPGKLFSSPVLTKIEGICFTLFKWSASMSLDLDLDLGLGLGLGLGLEI